MQFSCTNQSIFRNISLFLLTLLANFVLAQSGDHPPIEEGDFKPSDMVELIDMDSTFKLDIRYATTNNFIGEQVYDEARAFLQRDAALALVEVNKALRHIGLGLWIFDGYRPWSVTKLFWDQTPYWQKEFVANPSTGSRHNRGCAVDLTLYELKTGEQVKMTSDYDDMSARSHPNYKGGTEKQRLMRDLLRAKMEEHGFTVYPNEWWHFDFKGWEAYRIENIPFSEIH